MFSIQKQICNDIRYNRRNDPQKNNRCRCMCVCDQSSKSQCCNCRCCDLDQTVCKHISLFFIHYSVIVAYCSHPEIDLLYLHTTKNP
jgi:hypothetical protein